jgi:hypothetical protein
MFVLMRLYLGFRVLRDRSPLWRNRGMIETEMTQRCGTSLPACQPARARARATDPLAAAPAAAAAAAAPPPRRRRPPAAVRPPPPPSVLELS